MHRLVLRPLLVVLTLGMLVVALFQIVGRLGFMVLDDLELAANQWLSGQQIRVTGLQGSWRFLNPVLMIDRVDMPAGHLANVVVELDWLESLIRNRFVARRFVVDDGLLLVERRAGQWRLAGAAAQADFDLSGLLYHSDELSFGGSIVLRREDEEAAAPIRVDYTATNRGGIHRYQLRLRNHAGGCEDACRVSLEYQAREGLWPFWDETIQLQVDAERFRLPRPLLGVSALEVVSLGLNWHQVGNDSGGRLNLRVDGLRLPADVVLGGELRAQVQGYKGVHQAMIDHLTIQQRSDGFASEMRMPVVRVRKDPEIVQLWADGLDLGQVAGFLRNALHGMEVPSRWLGDLNVRAQALNLRGYLRLPTGEIGYAGTLTGIELDGFRGVPFMRGGAGELLGFAQGAQFKLKGQDMLLQFVDTFTDTWQLPYVQGLLQAWFKDGYIGLRGLNFRAETLFSRASGGFAVSRPSSRYEQRVTLLINVDAVEIEQARTFVPYKLSPGLAKWLEEGPREGLLSQVRFRYHGQTHIRPGELGRRVELTARISDGRVQYHPDWPEITDLSGEVAVAGQTVRLVVDRGVSAGARLAGTRVVLRDQAAYVDIELDAQVGTQDALNFARETPLRERLTFVGPDWTGAGSLHLQGNLHIPLGEPQNDEMADELGVDLIAAMVGTDLDMPDYRLTVNDLEGRVRYRYPNSLRGDHITGSLFGHDVEIGADSNDDEIILHFAGHASHADVLGVIDMEDPEAFAGSLDFVADLHIAMNADQATRLDITSDLQGMAVMLPGEFSKDAELARPIEVSLEFLDDYQVVRFRHGSAEGWMHVNDKPLRGAVGFATAPPVVDAAADYLLLTGAVEGFALEDVVPDDGEPGAALLPLRLVDLHVGHIDLDEFRIDDAVLNGNITASGFAITVASYAVAGELRLDGDQPLVINLEYVVFPESPEGEEASDPLRPQIIAELPRAVVEIHSLWVGDTDYGRWSFDLEPRPDGVLLANLNAELRGVNIVAPDGVMWFADTNESRFQGELTAGNLAEVLPLWDFAPSLETKSASLTGDLRWAGSPANVDLDLLFGEASVRADQGHFVDLESGGGAIRIFSLINFNAIAKRIRGDFSDVTGKGVSFEKLRAKVKFNGGSLTFVEPMKVTGTGSSFEVAGTVDLVNGALDNEMIVTLPVTKSLPWYAAYVALANPLVGAGILVGERVLRKPIEQFSSAKYAISGTLDDPDVNLVRVFDTSMKSAETSDALPVNDNAALEDESEKTGHNSEMAH